MRYREREDIGERRWHCGRGMDGGTMRWRGCKRNGVQGASCRKCACLRCRVGAPSRAPGYDTRHTLPYFNYQRVAWTLHRFRLDDRVAFASLASHCPPFSNPHAGVARWSRAKSLHVMCSWVIYFGAGPPTRRCTGPWRLCLPTLMKRPMIRSVVWGYLGNIRVWCISAFTLIYIKVLIQRFMGGNSHW